MAIEIVPGSIKSTGHVLLTGPITGSVELEDGTVVDVTPGFIEVDPDLADEIADKIGQRYAAEGHPDDVELDPETGEMVQREFVYVPPSEVPSDDKKK